MTHLEQTASPGTERGRLITFGYTNWRGEYSVRKAIPLRIERKESEWHGPGLHWVMVAWDIEKNDERDFLLTDIGRRDADADLLALTMLEALKGMRAEWEKLTRYGSPMAKAANEAVQAMNAAIALAEGRTPGELP